MEKLTNFAGSICIIAIVLMFRCPDLRPDLRPVVRSIGAAFDLYPKSEIVDVSQQDSPFHLKRAPGEESLQGLLSKCVRNNHSDPLSFKIHR